jgi:hypothetical protein
MSLGWLSDMKSTALKHLRIIHNRRFLHGCARRPDMMDHCTELQTEPPVCGQQGIAGHLRTHLTIAQDEVREHSEYRVTHRALETPDGDPTQADTGVMGVARQAPPAATGGLVFELKAEGEEESKHEFDKRLAIAQQAKVGRFILGIFAYAPAGPSS